MAMEPNTTPSAPPYPVRPPPPAAPSCNSTPPAQPPRVRIAMALAWVSGLLCIIAALALIVDRFHYQQVTPLDSPELSKLKAEMILKPKDEALKDQIRAVDLRLRLGHERHLQLVLQGQWLLGGGMMVFLIAIQTAIWRKKLCIIKKQKAPGEDVRAANYATVAVGALAVVVVAVGWALANTSETLVTPVFLKKYASAGTNATAEIVFDFPSKEEVLANWGQFHGPDGNGVALSTNTPLTWDVKSGANILWKTPIPSAGFSSPIIWSNRVFISGGSISNRAVMCFDFQTGKLLWERSVTNVPGSPKELPEVSDQTGFAAGTMATDGRRAYAMFASYDLGAVGMDGSLVWAKNFGLPKNQYGHASSLATWQGRLILQLDQGEIESKLSKLYAVDGATGKILWQKPRPVGSSWSSPIVIEAAGKPQIITLAVPWVIANDARDGNELWRVEGIGGEVTPSPVFAGGVLYALSPSEKLMAIRPDGQGDVTKTHVLWTFDENIPDIGTPVSNGDTLFMLTTMGMLTCLDAKTGKKVWEHDFQIDCHPSLTLAGSHLYIMGTKGIALVLSAGREFKELGRSEMNEKVYATPAFAQNRIVIRAETNLYCIGQAAK